MNQQNTVFQIPLKSTGIAYLLWLLLRFVGAHKFYLGRPMIGLLYLLTFGFLGLGVILDLFTMPSQVRAANDRLMRDSGAYFAASASPRPSSSGSHGDLHRGSFAEPSTPKLHDRQIDAMIDRYKEKLNSPPPPSPVGARPRPAFGKRNA